MPRHQSHLVANRNKRAAAARAQVSPPITVQAGEPTPYDGSGRLKVIPVREVNFHVPAVLGEGKFSYEDAVNPVNQLGAVLQQCVPVVTSNDFQSFMAAFNKRSNFVSEVGASKDARDEAIRFVRKWPRIFDEWKENDEDRQRWLSKFDAPKRERMEAAWLESAWASTDYIGTKDLSVKQEVLIKRDDPSWAPRVIYAGNDVFNAITGPASMVFMERLVALSFKHSFGPVEARFAYKATDTALASFLVDANTKGKRCCVEGDYSSNDKFQPKDTADIIDEVLSALGFRTLGADTHWFRTLLLCLESYKVQNKRFGLKARLKYQLPTGTTTTTPRNSAFNLVMFAVTCLRQGRRASAVILGDDLLALTNKRFNLKEWTATVADFRMVLKAKDPELNGEATFLSRRLITDRDQPCMVPLIGKALVRFNVRGTHNEQVSDSQYMAGKALSYAYEFRHVPVMREAFLRRYEMEDTKAVQLSDLTWFAKSSGIELSNIVQAIKDERVLVERDEFEQWLVLVYDCTLYELEPLIDDVILNPSMVVVDNPLINYFSKDYE